MSRGKKIFSYRQSSRGSSRVQEGEPELFSSSRTPPWSVAELNQRVKHCLENSIGFVRVRGEISGLRRQTSGHFYFSLKDGTSMVSAVLFRGDAALQTVQMKDGMQIVVEADLSVYEPRGTYQLIIRQIEEDGIGRLREEFEKLKARLAAEGLFAAERKRSLPSLARTVGIVTSPSGAALQDFLRILQRRGWKGRVLVFPSRVQGAEAPQELMAALRQAISSKLCDMVVLARGGGSLEDLWAFNDEALARAVFSSPVPVISAVGHETDVSLTDFVADFRAETPSAAAEIISSSYVEATQRMKQFRREMVSILHSRTSAHRVVLGKLHTRLVRQSPRHLVENAYLHLDDIARQMELSLLQYFRLSRDSVAQMQRRWERSDPQVRIERQEARVNVLEDKLRRLASDHLERRGWRVRSLADRLKALSPQSVLKRGFAMVENTAGTVLSRAGQFPSPGSPVLLRLQDGTVETEVLKITPGQQPE